MCIFVLLCDILLPSGVINDYDNAAYRGPIITVFLIPLFYLWQTKIDRMFDRRSIFKVQGKQNTWNTRLAQHHCTSGMQRRHQRTRTRGAMGSFWGAHGERVEHEPITGVWGAAPSGVQGQSPWLGGQGGEAESFLALRRATDRANLYLLQYFQQSIIIK